LEAQLAEARLLMLRAQLEPHFLFNTLNTVAVLMRDNVDAADRVLVLLSGLLRRALDTSALAEVELREEVAFLEAYLALERVRFADQISYRFDIASPLLGARVPSLILQPLVENAIRHGLSGHATDGQIRIAAASSDGMLELTVSDNGAGLCTDASTGVGLSNTRSRLQLLYGRRHSFELSAAPGGGVMARIVIPLVSEAA
jgi:LytS/YehU family sensor histidine kinase